MLSECYKNHHLLHQTTDLDCGTSLLHHLELSQHGRSIRLACSLKLVRLVNKVLQFIFIRNNSTRLKPNNIVYINIGKEYNIVSSIITESKGAEQNDILWKS